MNYKVAKIRPERSHQSIKLPLNT